MKCLVLLAIVATVLASDPELVPGVGIYFVLQEPSGVLSEFRWNEAMSTCKYRGGHLVVINSQEEAEAVSKIMNKYEMTYSHVGFTDIFTEGEYLTIQDETLQQAGYSAWATGYPNGGRTSNCGAINAKGELLDITCYQIFNVICEIDLWNSYTKVENLGYYQVYYEEHTWEEALKRCQQEGSSLAVINSKEEATAIKDLLLQSRSPMAFVGIHDQYIVGHFYTVDGKKIEETGYINWAADEPSEAEGRDVVAMDSLGQYHTMMKTTKLAYVCEHAL